jgi:hypothetical protein
MKGKIRGIYPQGRSSVYNYVCEGEGGLFSFPVEWRYHMQIVENEGSLIGREVEYENDSDQPSIRFLD